MIDYIIYKNFIFYFMSQLVLEKLISGFDVKNAKSFGKISFIPIIGDIDISRENVDIATDHIADIKISELESESVNQVNIESSHENPLLVLSGIVFEGGRQTRSPTRPFIINRGTKKTIPVNCIEQNRWSYSPEAKVSDDEKEFKLSKKHVNRRTKSALAMQSSTWGSISTMRETAGISADEAVSSNQMEIETIAFEKNHEKVENIKGEISSAFNLNNQRGIAILEDDKFVSLEVFDKPELWEKIWENLLESNLFDLLKEQKDESNEFDDLSISSKDFTLSDVEPVADEQSYSVKFGELEGWGVSYDKSNIIYLTINKQELASEINYQVQEQIQEQIQDIEFREREVQFDQINQM